MDTQTTPTVQPNKRVQGPKALFWYLSLFFTLAITATSTGAMWFQYINKLLPKEVAGTIIHAFSQGAVKYAIASLLVAAPLFFIFTFFIRKALAQKNLSTENHVRTWITYIILFITIAITVGDLIGAVLGILNGDFTPRFILKVLTILIISAWIFIYYWLELRSDNALSGSQIPKVFGIISIIAVATSFIGGFFLVDSPAVTREKAYDNTRVQNLSEIRYTIDNYYSENDTLPSSLEELTDYSPRLQTTDPQTGQSYKYAVVSETEFEICAEFTTNAKDDYKDSYYYYGPDGFTFEPGENCFTKEVNQFQKPIPAIR